MSKLKLIFLAVVIIAVIGILISVFSPPSQAGYYDNFTEDIGGDGFLVANLTHALKIGEKNIPDGSVEMSTGDLKYFDAKNISYVDYVGCDNYIIVWKTSPDKYGFFDTGGSENQYISDYSNESNEKCFIEYSYENNAVYGIIIGSKDNIKFNESQLMYDILGLDENGFDLVYTNSASGYSYSSSPSSHYHTVVPDRYSLSRSDPGAYYDHYEYGDNYEIDDYLESEGYD